MKIKLAQALVGIFLISGIAAAEAEQRIHVKGGGKNLPARMLPDQRKRRAIPEHHREDQKIDADQQICRRIVEQRGVPVVVAPPR